jgi:4-hydroxybenzoate polyprenyltransferase/phosphoserine phosphatase
MKELPDTISLSDVARVTSPPLFIDLDGTLVKTDLLVESYISLFKQRPLLALKAPLWLLRGKAYLKDRVAEAIEVDPTLLPYHPEMLSYVGTQREAGREIYLATASNYRYANAIARYLGVFNGVLASDRGNNLSGVRKLEAIRALCPSGFVYAGNNRMDLPIWEAAEGAILVDVPRPVAEKVSNTRTVEARFSSPESGLAPLLKAIRPQQWLKNLLVFLPLLPIVSAANRSMLGMAVLAFAAFSLCASSVYLLNDLSDLAADRSHPRKCKRPFASGALAPLHGLMLIPVLLALAFALTLLLPGLFGVVLGIYWLSTGAYTFYLKRRVLIAVVTLALLYSLRVLGGGAAIGVTPSFWILAFSMFIFLSLALTKRYAELYSKRALNWKEAESRGYYVDDLHLVQLMGVASGYLSVLVMALYINSPEIIARYQHVHVLWGVCPLLILWISRVWLKASRGEMTDDPLVFAAKDRTSRYVVVLAMGLILTALL